MDNRQLFSVVAANLLGVQFFTQSKFVGLDYVAKAIYISEARREVDRSVPNKKR